MADEEPTIGAQSLNALLDALATPPGTPAGGTATAVSGAMAAALVELCCRAGAARATGAQAERLGACERAAAAARGRLLRLGAQDDAAYRGVLAARRLPVESELERRDRTRALESAMRAATGIPREIATTCLDVLALTTRAVTDVPRTTLGDLGVAARLSLTCAQSAVLIVRVNLSAISDPAVRTRTESALHNVEHAPAHLAHVEQVLQARLAKAGRRTP